MKKYIFVLFLLLSCFAQATNYYVAKNGNDTSGNGSLIKPFRMPSKAASVAITSGDVINIAAGIYQDNNYCDLAIGVNMTGAGKTLTIIRTSYVYEASPTTPSYGYIRLYSSTITNGNQSVSGIGFDGLGVAYRAITVYKRGSVSVNNCDFKNFKASAVIFFNTANNSMDEPIAYVSGNSFNNNSTLNCTTYGIANAGHISLLAQEKATVYNNTMIDQRRADTGYVCVTGLSCRKIKIYNNTFKRGVKYSSYWTFTIEFRFSFGENEVYGNTFEGPLDMCNNMKKETGFGLSIHDNIFGSSDGKTHEYGVQLEGTNIGVSVLNNTFKNTRYGFSITTNMPDHACLVDSILIAKNLFQNIGYPSTRFTGGAIVLSGSTTYSFIPQYRNIMIYNNTLIGNGFATSAIWLKTKGYYDDIKIKNNIVYNFDKGTPFGPIYIDKDINQVMVVDSLFLSNNIMFENGNANRPVYSKLTPTNVIENNNLIVNPFFVSSSDFNLKAGSPAINAGTFVNLPFNEGEPDIGAFESNYTPIVNHALMLNGHIFRGSKNSTRRRKTIIDVDINKFEACYW